MAAVTSLPAQWGFFTVYPIKRGRLCRERQEGLPRFIGYAGSDDVQDVRYVARGTLSGTPLTMRSWRLLSEWVELLLIQAIVVLERFCLI